MIVIGHSLSNDIGRCFPFKEKHVINMESCVVYHLKCSDCNADYIGKSSRQIIRRFEEHQRQERKLIIIMILLVMNMKKRIIIKFITIILKF
jgi:hypothetical protein